MRLPKALLYVGTTIGAQPTDVVGRSIRQCSSAAERKPETSREVKTTFPFAVPRSPRKELNRFLQQPPCRKLLEIKDLEVSLSGLEPETYGLKVRCSTN